MKFGKQLVREQSPQAAACMKANMEYITAVHLTAKPQALPQTNFKDSLQNYDSEHESSFLFNSA